MTSSHTVLLLQSTSRFDSRTWSDFESITECLEGVCKIFEAYLAKKQGTPATEITYDVNQIFEFLDKLTDLSVMVFNRETAQYVPRNRAWIKHKIFELMRSRCGHPETGEKLIVGY